MAYRNKVFVSFDGDNDIHYYRLMRAWKQSDRTSFNFSDAHGVNTALDTSTEVTIKRRLGQRMANSKVLVSLIGEQTRYLYKFVRWELEHGRNLGLPIIGVNLNGLRWQDPDRCPPVIRDSLAIYVSFQPSILQHALENWPSEHVKLGREGESGPFYYNQSIYSNLGI